MSELRARFLAHATNLPEPPRTHNPMAYCSSGWFSLPM